MSMSRVNYKRSKNADVGIKPLALSRNLFTVTIAIMVIAFALTILYFERQLRQQVEDEVYQSLERLSSRAEDVLAEQISRHRRNLLFLYGTPPVSGFARAAINNGIDPSSGTEIERLKTRLETVFSSMLQNNPEIDQLRVISAEDPGLELVRVDRLTGRILAVGDANLQEKSETDYFARATQLSPNEVYISPISLNREYGELEYPHRPTIRFAVSIFQNTGERFGFLIINVQASSMIQALRDSMDGEAEVILSTPDGDFIEHPIEEYRFSRDLDHSFSWSNSYELAPSGQGGKGVATNLLTGLTSYYFESKMTYSAGEDSFDNVITIIPETFAIAQMNQRRVSLYGVMVIAFIVLCTMLWFVRRNVRSSLNLAEARAEQEAIVENSSDVVVGLDFKGRITSWNRAAGALFNKSVDEVIGRNLNSFNFYEGMDIGELIDRVRQEEDKIAFDYEYQSPGQDSTFLAVTITRIESNNYSFAGVALIAHDITLQKNSESEIRKINAELEAQVEVRTRELHEAHQQALQASEFKSAFISSVSHEMRTPLNGMIGMLSLVRRASLSPEQHKYIDMAETSTLALSGLINDVLDLSKIEAGKLDFESKVFNPRHVVELNAVSNSIRAHAKGLEVILETSKIVHESITGDANRLKQVLNNLISNAIKFTGSGEILISASTRRNAREQVELHVAIADTGIGIKKENKHKLFQEFSQADSNISGDFGGTGLGLSISKQLCLLQGGDIKFESTFGKGSTFSFYISYDGNLCQDEQPRALLQDRFVVIAVGSAALSTSLQNIVRKYGVTIVEQWPEAEDSLTHVTKGQSLVLTDFTGEALGAIAGQVKAAHWNARIIQLQTTTMQSADISDNRNIITKPVVHEDLLRAAIDDYVSPKTTLSSGVQALPQFEKMPNVVVMVVDDNDINLEVACGLLEPLGVSFKTAVNGQEALEALKSAALAGERVDCLLMDCQMPVMSGYECSKRIREGLAGDEFKDIPIIAMTANAMSGEREACMAAGMSDYLTKPLSSKHLLEKVSHWAKVKLSQSASVAPQEVSQDLAEGELPTWDREAAMTRMFDNDSLVNRICHMYLESVDEKFLQLENSVSVMNIQDVKADSHKLRGLSGDIGASRIHHYFAKIESAADIGDETEINAIFLLAKSELAILTPLISSYLAKTE